MARHSGQCNTWLRRCMGNPSNKKEKHRNRLSCVRKRRPQRQASSQPCPWWRETSGRRQHDKLRARSTMTLVVQNKTQRSRPQFGGVDTQHGDQGSLLKKIKRDVHISESCSIKGC